MHLVRSLGRRGRWIGMIAGLAILTGGSLRAQGATATKRAVTPFAATIARLSEPSGYFDTDNLISNETSYLHVLPALHEMGVSGGAYIGVGPDQNYTYLAAIHARIAYIVDIRRDNLLQHLMFKALFARSRNRMEFLCRWLGRVPPPDVASWDSRPIAVLLDWVDRQPANSEFAKTEADAIVAAAVATGVPLSEQDAATIRRFHAAFVKDGLQLRFTSFNRGPRPYYPTLERLIVEKDPNGRQASYLATEEDWRFVKGLHAADRIIPVVGNFAGSVALKAIAKDLQRMGEKVTAIYTSNVEQYIWRDGSFPKFADNVVALPLDRRGVIIRSYFGAGSGGQPHPRARDGYYSTQLVQALSDFAERHRKGGWTSYWELVTEGNR
ncbi:MAG: hypothetical protein U0132_09145 [Gemmatimonadaceae bacterium]